MSNGSSNVSTRQRAAFENGSASRRVGEGPLSRRVSWSGAVRPVNRRTWLRVGGDAGWC